MKRMRECLKDSRGFNLIEIMTVLFIVGLITAITVPNFQRHQEQGKIAKTKANLENIRTAIALYYEEEGLWPSSDLSSLTAAPSGHVYLPEIPSEAFYNSNVVSNTPYYDGGWYWDTFSNELHPDVSGVDANGMAFTEY